jgi:Rieske Fe-S protein
MVAYVQARGGTVRTGATVERLLFGADGRVRAARLAGAGAPTELGRFPLADVPADGTPIAKTLASGTKILVRRVGAGVAVHSAICTHAGGPVGYRAASAD